MLVDNDLSRLVIRKFPFKKIGSLENEWLTIYDQYYKRRKISPKNLKQIVKVNQMKMLYNAVASLLGIVLKAKGELLENALQALAKAGYGIDKGKDFNTEYERVYNDWVALQSAINIEEGRIEKAKKLEGNTLLKEVVSMEDLLKRELDPYRYSVSKWIEMVEREIRKIKAREAA